MVISVNFYAVDDPRKKHFLTVKVGMIEYRFPIADSLVLVVESLDAFFAAHCMLTDSFKLLVRFCNSFPVCGNQIRKKRCFKIAFSCQRVDDLMFQCKTLLFKFLQILFRISDLSLG